MSAIGIDVGYGYTKSFAMNNGVIWKLLLPTAISAYTPDFHFGRKIPIIKVNNQKFAVGEELVFNWLPYESTVREDFVGSPSYMAVLGYVLSRSGFSASVLVAGLPPNFYNRQRAEELGEQMKNQRLFDDQGKAIEVPNTIKVIPQGTGIFFSHVKNYPGSFHKNTLVIDLGYYTLDVIFFSGGRYIEGAAASFPMGVKLIYDEVRKLFGKVYGSFAKDDDSLDEILKYGRYTHFGKEYPLDAGEIIQSYRTLINSTIKSHTAKAAKKIELVLAGGGGITLFMETMKSIIPVTDPQFANAIGFYEYGKQFLKG